MNLGKLEQITDLRSVWKHEAKDFTPWLAKEENLEILSEAVGIDIVLEEQESNVGDFSVDLYATEEGTGRRIIIENQLEETNHDHLGKIITYASGKDAEVIVWIVKKARDEHKQAIEWLNQHTDDKFEFFLIEIELWKINDSDPAPKFNIVERPNNWAKAMKKTAGLSETENLKLAFWEQFNNEAPKHSAFIKEFKLRKPQAQHWYDLGMGSSAYHLCMTLVKKNPEGEKFLFPSLLSYAIEFCSHDDLKTFLDEYQNWELTKDEAMNFARGYSKIGEYDKALNILAEISPTAFILDSLKYASVKIEILEKQGKYELALNLYRDYSAMLERYQSELLSQDLLFSDKKHQLEIESLMQIQDRDRIIWATLCGIFTLIILVGWLYYRAYCNKTKRILAEKENENLKLEHDNLRKEKERVELERDKKTLETENLRLEISQLESERNNLKELQKKRSEWEKPIQDVIKKRLDMLNGLLAKEVTQNDNYAEPYKKWIETIHNDKKKFMDSTRLAFAASHPQFMTNLEQHGLSTDEINYLCLYAIGMRGKEVGEYLQIKRHYIISHEIRMKLGIDEHETNIGLYIRRLMKNCEE